MTPIISTKLVRLQLEIFKPLVTSPDIDRARKGQDALGAIMSRTHRDEVEYEPCLFDDFDAEWITPHEKRLDGVLLYLHGGGYVGGDLDYAKGFGTILAAEYGVKVLCPAYRLAPESTFPAALDDAVAAYRHILEGGVSPKKVALCGESAGGGLIFALCLRLKELGLEQPGGLVGISPWSDLTGSGPSYEENAKCDPSMTRELLQFYAACYAGDDTSNPLVSPVFGAFAGLPRSLIFVGGDEVMRSDAEDLYKGLAAAGCQSELIVTPQMWHAYILYGVKEAQKDYIKIGSFLEEVLG